MIDIQISEHTIQVRGHAQYAPRGHDIVCASVSVLMLAFEDSLQRSADKLEVFETDRSEGMSITAVPKESYAREYNAVRDMTYNALLDLGYTYPKYIKISTVT